MDLGYSASSYVYVNLGLFGPYDNGNDIKYGNLIQYASQHS